MVEPWVQLSVVSALRWLRGVRCPRALFFCALLVGCIGCDVQGTLLAVEQVAGGSVETAGTETQSPNLPADAVVSVAAGREHTCALRLDGELFCWGEIVPDRDPERIDLDLAVIQHSGGDDFHCVLDEAGEVFCFGDNDSGQLGIRDFQSRRVPVRVQLPANAVSVSAGSDHACAVLENQGLYCWGSAEEGVLGLPIDVQRSAFSPVQIQGASAWNSVAACFGHTCALDGMNALYCWGRNSDGQAGQPPSREPIVEPMRVSTETDWQSLACGLAASCGLRRDALFCWGAFHLDDTSIREEPVLASFDAPEAMLEGVSVVDVATHTFTTCAVDSGGGLYCWGRGIEGQLGLGDNTARQEPTLVPTAARVVDVSVGWFHVCAVYDTGQVACSGENDEGQLGTGDDRRRDELTVISLP